MSQTYLIQYHMQYTVMQCQKLYKCPLCNIKGISDCINSLIRKELYSSATCLEFTK